jgi:hypothetical protein
MNQHFSLCFKIPFFETNIFKMSIKFAPNILSWRYFSISTKPPQGIRVDTCSYLYIRLYYIIMVIEKSNAWLLHVTMVLNFFRSQMSPQKASRSLIVLSWHPVVLWEFFLKYAELVVLWFWLFKYPDPTVLWFWIFQLPAGTTVLLFWFFFKYLEPTKIEGPPQIRNLSMLGGY